MEQISLQQFFDEMNVDISAERSARNDQEIVDFFHGIDDGQVDLGDLPYEFVTEVEQRGDGSGYETFFVFQRKSDGKTFAYYIYDGMIEQRYLQECTIVVQHTRVHGFKTSKWDFECTY